jgi:putative ABC transport system ATP-binding protein
MQPIIQTINITKTYGMGSVEVRALDGIQLTIQEGEFVAVMGPSGSGKSTLMNILGCLDRPTTGNYILAGEDMSGFNRTQLAHIRNERLGFIFQSYNLLPRLTALENVMLPLLYTRENHISGEQQVNMALESLTAVGLSERAGHHPAEMSGGEIQRVAIARALINTPLLILADEPTGNLDTRSGEEIMEILHELHNQGRTIVMVTHDDHIARHAGRVIHFLDGRIATDQQNGGSKPAAREVAHAAI